MAETSRITQTLCRIPHDYTKEASKDRTFQGQLKTNLVGRALVLGVSMLLHAEAVCRAVYICFLTIKDSFSQTDHELIKRQAISCSGAYKASWESFFTAIFQYDPKKLKNSVMPKTLISEQTKVVQIERRSSHLANFHADSGSDDDFVQVSAKPSPTLTPFDSEFGFDITAPSSAQSSRKHSVISSDGFEHVQYPSNPPSVHSASTFNSETFEEIELPPNNVDKEKAPSSHGSDGFGSISTQSFDLVGKSPAGSPHQLPLEPDSPPIEIELPSNKSNGEKTPSVHSSDTFDTLSTQSFDVIDKSPTGSPRQQPIEPDSPPGTNKLSDSPEIPQECIHQAIEYMTALIHPSTQSIRPLQQEKLLIEQEKMLLSKRIEALAMQLRPLSPTEVEKYFHTANEGAHRQIDLHQGNFQYLTGINHHFDDIRWEINTQQMGSLNIAYCQYTYDKSKVKPENLFNEMVIKIGRQNYPVKIFGILDPYNGQRAALFIKESFQDYFEKNVVEMSNNRLTDASIFNALSRTLLELNQEFLSSYKDKKLELLDKSIAEQGCSAIIAVQINKKIWIANLGSSRAVAAIGPSCTQITEDQFATMEPYRNEIQTLGGHVDEQGLVNGEFSRATLFGCYGLNKVLSAKPFINVVDLRMTPNGSRLFLGTSAYFEGLSSRNIANTLHIKEKLSTEQVAHDLTYSIQKHKEVKSLACMHVELIKDIGSSSWEPVERKE
ncbi:MAG: hypothetical protein COT85_00975 [Chlamydiae bacterium CG10_big_fil_rev_8_21_14_0_10_42_34]|nr:MAG: hypothetical protein COT85_00975 [Chlamydiae bacterium CG10_big_fil_rev_8_21_14_0_10_42_34]